MRPLPDHPYTAALLAPTWLGDSVMATALIPRLRTMSGNPVEIWSRPAFTDLFTDHPDVGRVLPFDPKGRHGGLGGLMRWRNEVGAGGSKPAAVWILPDSLSSALAARAAGIPCRIGRPNEGRSLLLSHPVRTAVRQKQHWIEEQAELLSPFHADDLAAIALEPAVHVPAQCEASLRDILAERDIDPDKCCIFIVGATYGPTKRWNGFYDLTHLLPEETSVLLVGAAGDSPFTGPLAARLSESGRPVHDLCRQLDLPQLTALMRSVRYTVANDTGPMHLAAASGGRVLGLFASTSPLWTSPRGKQVRWVHSGSNCSPCFSKTCRRDDFACLTKIKPAQVLTELGDWL
ncbi:MAG: glycosyltransferase family 9 protein [bacterium]|nr:glycosyltransferase family 9 protein [bacterium]